MEGVWIKNYSDARIPFKAYFGKDHRFTTLRKEPVADVSGNWAVTFGKPGEEPYPGVAEFRQNGNYLTGTFRTETGDYRYLEGTVQADRLYLSVFDGSHAFLFEAQIQEGGGALVGTFRSGRSYITGWTAERDDNAELASPDELTQLTTDAPLSFTFPDVDGNPVSLDDPRFAGRPKLVTIFGTWCPNCRDEADFLKDYLASNDTGDLQVLSLAFERYGPDDDRSRAAIRRYRENMNVDWPILLAGSSDKDEASRALPMLNRVISYPTMLFVDRDNRVRRIHTGFNGPATSKYAEFKTSFDRSIQELLAADARGTDSK